MFYVSVFVCVLSSRLILKISLKVKSLDCFFGLLACDCFISQCVAAILDLGNSIACGLYLQVHSSLLVFLCCKSQNNNLPTLNSHEFFLPFPALT